MHAFQDDTLSVPSPRGVGQNGRGPQQPAPNVSTPQTVLTRVLLVGSLLTGAISHGYHLFLYPLYITDEGIYMGRPWWPVSSSTCRRWLSTTSARCCWTT